MAMSDVSQLLESRRGRIGRWSAAALVVCGLHAGALALALMQPPEPDDADDIAGAVTVELAPAPAPAPVDAPDLAHGPELKEYAPPVPEASKKVEQQVEDDIPPVEPSPAPEPEVALPKPQPEKKEEEEPEEEAQEVQAQPPREAKDEVSTAPPRVEAPPAPSASSKAGQSTRTTRVQLSWQKAVSEHLHRYMRYPRAARGLRGSAAVRFVLDRSGRVTLAEIIKSSGSPILDQEALATVRRASPMPIPPSEVEDAYLEFTPILFHYK